MACYALFSTPCSIAARVVICGSSSCSRIAPRLSAQCNTSHSLGWATPARCRLLYAAGCFRHMHGDLADARALFEELLALSRRLGFQRGIGMALHGLGELLTIQGEYAAARGSCAAPAFHCAART